MKSRFFTICTREGKRLVNLNHVSIVKLLNYDPTILQIKFERSDIIHTCAYANEQNALNAFYEIPEKMGI